jgi:hypothetical protein
VRERAVKAQARSVWAVGCGLGLVASMPACGAGGARSATSAHETASCRERLPGTSGLSTSFLTDVAALPAVPAPLSRLVVEADIDAVAALAEAEKSVPRELGNGGAGDSVSVGEAGQLTMRVRRGDFALEMGSEGEEGASEPGHRSVGVRVPLVGNATLCRPLGPLGCVEVARCEPDAVASAFLVPLLDDSYHFPPPEVAIAIGRGCTLTAFRFDITPRLQAEANAQAERLRSRIEAALPEVREPLGELWGLLGTTLPLGRGTCARLTPRSVIQTGARLENGHVRGGVGVLGELRLESPCGPSTSPGPLPAPVVRPHREGEGSVDLQVPITIPWDEVSRAAAESLSSLETMVRRRPVHVTDAALAVTADGQATIRLIVAGPVCGEITARGALRWRPDRNAIALSGVRVEATEAERLGLAPGEAARLAERVEASFRLPLPVDITSLGSNVRKTLDALLPKPTPGARASATAALPTIEANLDEAQISLLRPTREGLTAVVQAPGQITAKLGRAP